MAESLQWRRVVATLADPDRRLLYARLVVEGAPVPLAGLDTAGRKRLAALAAAGLAVIGEAGASAGDPFRALLSAEPAQRPTGPERFLNHGRLEVLPRTQRDRLEVFAWLADRVIAGAESLDEKAVTSPARRVGRRPGGRPAVPDQRRCSDPRSRWPQLPSGHAGPA